MSPESRSKTRGTILLIVTGSIAAFKAAALASKLTQDGFEVRTVLSPGALEFVRPATFEGLTGSAPYESMFADGDAMAHIDLARWADLTLVYPASANSLTKFAHGAAGDLIGTLFLAMNLETTQDKNAVWIAPAMNPSMLAHPAVREAIEKLSGWGCRVLESGDGRMACGEVGYGRLIEPEEILVKIRAFFGLPTGKTAGGKSAGASEPTFASRASLKGRRILVTAGATSEQVDPVRVLTNVSTGETGVRVANALSSAGAEVSVLVSNSSPYRSKLHSSIRALGFDGFADLDARMREELGGSRYDTLVHAAAVSDYSVDRVEDAKGGELAKSKKIRSGEGIRLVLKPNPKILDRVREYSARPDFRVVSFKLSATGGKGAPDLSGYSSDWIVHNPAETIERGTERHAGEIFARSAKRSKTPYQAIARFETKDELCRRLIEILTPAVAPGKRWFRPEDLVVPSREGKGTEA